VDPPAGATSNPSNMAEAKKRPDSTSRLPETNPTSVPDRQAPGLASEIRAGDSSAGSDKELRLLEVGYAARAYPGPMPPPELLRAYADISPDLVNRMMSMAEAAQKHASKLDLEQAAAAREDMQKSWRVVMRGQLCGVAIGLGGLIAGVLSLRIAPNGAGATMGSVLGGGGIATLIWAFRYDRIREQAREEETQEAISHRNTAKPDLGERPGKRPAKKRKSSSAPKLGG